MSTLTKKDVEQIKALNKLPQSRPVQLSADFLDELCALALKGFAGQKLYENGWHSHDEMREIYNCSCCKARREFKELLTELYGGRSFSVKL